jgi:hypothetical protein
LVEGNLAVRRGDFWQDRKERPDEVEKPKAAHRGKERKERE